MKPQREYFYLPLADAIKSIGVRVNLFALLEHVGRPYLNSSSGSLLSLFSRAYAHGYANVCEWGLDFAQVTPVNWSFVLDES